MIPQENNQNAAELERLGQISHDYIEEWKERAFKKEILRLFLDYFCINHRIPLKEIMNDVEKTLLVRVLTQFNGN